MKKVLIVPNPYLKDKENIIRDVIANLGSIESSVFDEGLDNEEAYERLKMMLEDCDCIITLGGDGSILKVAECAARKGLPLLGINYGSVGYLTGLDKDELELLSDLENDDYETESRMMLEVMVMADREYHQLALNDIMIVKSEINVPIKLMVNDSDLYYGDGIIIATPTGSSAYSYSAGGPLLMETSREMVLTPICPVGRKQSYRIYDDDRQLVIKSIRDTRDEAIVSIDGFRPIRINNKSTVQVSASKLDLKLIRI
ncbi:MAG: NAD(+)/NADH kinase [Erysipelotrichaceae bacterium]|nr:NAD(+)/NADH kinase [Erysipelotrichaceae bacterium]